MKNKIIFISFVLSSVFSQFLSACENGASNNQQNNIDVSTVSVFYYSPEPEEGKTPRPLSPAENNDAERAQEALQGAIESGVVLINSGDEVNLTLDRQTGEIFVDVTVLDKNGNFVEAFCDRIADGRS